MLTDYEDVKSMNIFYCYSCEKDKLLHCSLIFGPTDVSAIPHKVQHYNAFLDQGKSHLFLYDKALDLSVLSA